MFNDSFFKVLLSDFQAMGFKNAQLLACYAYAQACHESADFSSGIYKSANNPIGYKQYKGSDYQMNNGAGNYKGYAIFENDNMAAHELTHWINRRRGDFINVATLDDYINKMALNRYFGAANLSEYRSGLPYYYNKYPMYGKDLPPVVVTATTKDYLPYLLLAGVAGYFLYKKKMLRL